MSLFALSFGLLVAITADDVPVWQGESPRRIAFDVEVAVPAETAADGPISLWAPLPPSTGYQLLEEVRIDGIDGYKLEVEPAMVREDVFGNQALYLELPAQPRPRIRYTYHMTRRPQHGLDQPPPTDAPPAVFTQPSRLVPIDGVVAAEAERVAGGIDAPLIQANRLFNNIVDTVTYDKSGEGWGRGDAVYACDVRRGNCTDFHALFVGEARSLGIPARFHIGFSVPRETAGTVAGYHCWAEFFTVEYGWAPVDASEAFNNPRKQNFYFGNLDADRVEFSRGRDLRFPHMAGEPLNYFVYPYAEQNGTPVDGLEYTFRYRELPAGE